jgi:hypothetical protein
MAIPKSNRKVVNIKSKLSMEKSQITNHYKSIENDKVIEKHQRKNIICKY